jgi:hypothetical protein
MATNDNDSRTTTPAFPLSDGHGRAALLLVESLIHGLCEKKALNPQEAVEIAERALEVQFEEAEEADGSAAPMWKSHSLLAGMTASLRIDAESGPMPPYLVT